MKGKKSALAGIVVICVLGSAVWYTSVSGTLTKEPEPQAPKARPIPTERVSKTPDQVYRSFPAIIRAKGRVNMAFSVDGLLTELNAVEGTPVVKGDIIARLDQRDAENAYQAAQARYEVAKKDFERSQKLFDRQIIPPAEFDTSRSTYDVAAAEMRIKKKAFDDTILRAPFDGIVSKRYVENFQHIKAKDNILSLKDISKIEVVIQVPERLIAHGGGNRFSEVQVRFDAAPLSWYPAVIKEFSIESDPITRTYNVVVTLDPPADVEILPGMTATVRAPTKASASVSNDNRYSSIIPLSAVVGDTAGGSYVWVIPESDGNPVKREVQTGEIRKDGIVILTGLDIGELIATAGVHSLRSTMLVRPALKDREGLDQ